MEKFSDIEHKENNSEYIFSEEIDHAINDYISAKTHHINAIKDNTSCSSEYKRELIKKADLARREQHNHLAAILLQKGYISGLDSYSDEDKLREARDSATHYVGIFESIHNMENKKLNNKS